MADRKLLVLLIVSVNLVFCKSAFVDTLEKCSISDNNCLKQLMQLLLRDVGEKGIPEMNISPKDPFQIKGLHVTILDLLNFTITEGTVEGVKKCEVLKLNTNFDTGHSSAEILCNITINGKYKAASSSPLIKTFLGAESVHGNGNGKVKIEKLKLIFDFTFEVVKHDENLYMLCNFNHSKHSYDILSKVQFYADNLYVGKEESSKAIVKTLNENWKLLTDAAGKQFLDLAMKYVYEFIKEFYDKVPLKYFIIEDLSSNVVR